MRLAYLGTSDFAATVLRHLAGTRQRPALVVTPPDRKQGRGRRLSPPPVAIAAQELELELHQTRGVNDPESVAAMGEARIDVAMVCAFGQLIKPPLLNEIEMLNVHPSLLPRWRGAAPIERALMAGDEETGVAIIRLTEGLDSGPVALLERVAIAAEDDYGSLSARLAERSGELAEQALALRAAGELSFEEQATDGITYAEKIDPEDRRLDAGTDAVALERVVRALTPHIGAFVELEGGERLGIVKASAVNEGPPAGELEGTGDALLFGTPRGALRIAAVKPAGKREMPVSDYLRGHPAPSPAR